MEGDGPWHLTLPAASVVSGVLRSGRRTARLMSPGGWRGSSGCVLAGARLGLLGGHLCFGYIGAAGAAVSADS